MCMLIKYEALNGICLDIQIVCMKEERMDSMAPKTPFLVYCSVAELYEMKEMK